MEKSEIHKTVKIKATNSFKKPLKNTGISQLSFILSAEQKFCRL